MELHEAIKRFEKIESLVISIAEGDKIECPIYYNIDGTKAKAKSKGLKIKKDKNGKAQKIIR